MEREIGKIFYILGLILAFILALIIIIQMVRMLIGGSWAVEDVILALVIFNLSMGFGIGGYLVYLNEKISKVNEKISKVDAKITGHFGWHKGKEKSEK